MNKKEGKKRLDLWLDETLVKKIEQIAIDNKVKNSTRTNKPELTLTVTVLLETALNANFNQDNFFYSELKKLVDREVNRRVNLITDSNTDFNTDSDTAQDKLPNNPDSNPDLNIAQDKLPNNPDSNPDLNIAQDELPNNPDSNPDLNIAQDKLPDNTDSNPDLAIAQDKLLNNHENYKNNSLFNTYIDPLVAYQNQLKKKANCSVGEDKLARASKTTITTFIEGRAAIKSLFLEKGELGLLQSDFVSVYTTKKNLFTPICQDENKLILLEKIFGFAVTCRLVDNNNRYFLAEDTDCQ